MDQTPEDWIAAAQAAFEQAADETALANAKAHFLGKEGVLTLRLKGLATAVIPQERAALGKRLNQVKVAIEALFGQRQEALHAAALAESLAAQAIDVSLPGRGAGRGRLHPVTLTIERIEALFRSVGFDVADGPEVEEDFFNFTALNTPANHPARSMHDTFYLDARDAEGRDLLLRTHTSPMQIRYARSHRPPIKVIAPGKTFRVDSDATHSPMFHQIEGLWIDEDVSFADLKALYGDFLRRFFERDDLELRFRPSYFPFTEPSAEVDMRFPTGPLAGRWLEVSGCGQVHPQVVRNVGLDPERYTGFAFGSGIERLAMLRYGVGDLRMFYENDLRFLEQFQG